MKSTDFVFVDWWKVVKNGFTVNILRNAELALIVWPMYLYRPISLFSMKARRLSAIHCNHVYQNIKIAGSIKKREKCERKYL